MEKHHVNFKEDERFKQCNKELVYTLIFFVINVALVGGLCFLLAYNKPSDELTIVGGFPAWYFYGGVISTIILCVLTFIMVKYLFKDMSLDAYEKEGGDE